MLVLPKVMGLPPQNNYSLELTSNSLPVMEIIPCRPEVSETLFTLIDDTDSYTTILEELGYSLGETPIKLAFVADNFPTETFSNQYSESFLNRFTDLISTGTAELTQITGAYGAGDAVRNMLAAMGSSKVGLISAFGAGAQGALTGLETGFKDLTGKMGKMGQRLNRFADMAGSLLGGARADFPMIWKNSGYSPSYTITVRLYNPVPSNEEMKELYIIGPLAAITLLALPRTNDGTFYNWPFFHQINVPGLFQIPSAFIGSVTVIKGGDQQQITYAQDLGMIDLRIEFGSLFDTMVVGNKDYNATNRPTLRNYLDNLRNKRTTWIRDEETGSGLIAEDLEYEIDKRQNQGTVDLESEPGSRVSVDDSTTAQDLERTQPDVGTPIFGQLKEDVGVTKFWNGNSWETLIPGTRYTNPDSGATYRGTQDFTLEKIEPGSKSIITNQREYRKLILVGYTDTEIREKYDVRL